MPLLVVLVIVGFLYAAEAPVCMSGDVASAFVDSRCAGTPPGWRDR